MPYVLRHRETGEIAAAVLKNVYDLDYYGVKWWEREEEAEAEAAAFVSGLPTNGAARPDCWDVVQADESRIKLMNVKLKNNPALMIVFHLDGRLEAKWRE